MVGKVTEVLYLCAANWVTDDCSHTELMQHICPRYKALARIMLGVLLLLHCSYLLHYASHHGCAQVQVETEEAAEEDYTRCVLCDLGILNIVSTPARAVFVSTFYALLLSILLPMVARERSAVPNTHPALRAPPSL